MRSDIDTAIVPPELPLCDRPPPGSIPLVSPMPRSPILDREEPELNPEPDIPVPETSADELP
jgi:hypothetical protein